MCLLSYIHLQVHPKDVKTVTLQYTIYLLNYKRHNNITVYEIYTENYQYIKLQVVTI